MKKTNVIIFIIFLKSGYGKSWITVKSLITNTSYRQRLNQTLDKKLNIAGSVELLRGAYMSSIMRDMKNILRESKPENIKNFYKKGKSGLDCINIICNSGKERYN